MSNKTYGAGDGRVTPQKANMTAMADGGGLKGYMSGGGVYDNLMTAQLGTGDFNPNPQSKAGDTRDVSQLLKNLAAHKGPQNKKFSPPWKTQPGINMGKPSFKNAKSGK